MDSAGAEPCKATLVPKVATGLEQTVPFCLTQLIDFIERINNWTDRKGCLSAGGTPCKGLAENKSGAFRPRGAFLPAKGRGYLIVLKIRGKNDNRGQGGAFHPALGPPGNASDAMDAVRQGPHVDAEEKKLSPEPAPGTAPRPRPRRARSAVHRFRTGRGVR